jgi:excisionase family DNA binding protein
VDNPTLTPVSDLPAESVQPAVSVEQAAQFLGIGRSTVYQLMDGGHLRYLRYPGVRARRIKVADLQQFMASCGQGGWAAEQH